MQVAYGGYVAFGSLGGGAFVPLTPPAGLVVPSMVEDGDGDDDDHATRARQARAAEEGDDDSEHAKAATQVVADWPKLPEVRQWLRLAANADDDAIISSALAAAIDFGNRRTDCTSTTRPSSPTGAGPRACNHEACLMHAARLYKRRDSIDGALGWGDSGIIRVGRADPDITSMYTTPSRAGHLRMTWNRAPVAAALADLLGEATGVMVFDRPPTAPWATPAIVVGRANSCDLRGRRLRRRRRRASRWCSWAAPMIWMVSRR